VEVGFWVAGPAAAILADWGDVVKVEPLIGINSGMSAYFAAAIGEDMSPPFELDNPEALDRRRHGTDAGRAVLADLIAAPTSS
jgi:hypothetical protein